MELTSAKRLSLDDKELFDNYFQNYPPQNSEFTFTNLFMWRKFYEWFYLEWNNHLVLFSKEYFKKSRPPLAGSNDAIYFFPPIGPDPAAMIFNIAEIYKTAEFNRVSEDITNSIISNERFVSLNFQIVEDRDNWDYVYEVETLKTLPGNRHRQNRRWLNKFLETYDYQFEILTEELIDKCKKLQLEWCVMRQCEEDEGLEQEQEAIYEALDNFSALGFKGALICIDDKCAGYTFGEILNSDTLVIHVEKAHMVYDGGYQAIGNLFLSNVFSDIPFVNREQDLGVEGLRRAKESYKPIRMVKKSIIYRKD
ncbi:MAG: DUF2156 domain-containing protein [Candidatus Lokiarchaeota archaeon]|nr:DUF2156 domain-containing protein [Candidatus Lokiarchaeota archaeon]